MSCETSLELAWTSFSFLFDLVDLQSTTAEHAVVFLTAVATR